MWIFNTDELKEHFLELIERYKAKYHLKVYHYAIMSNHFHLAIEGDIQEISAFISGLCSRYTIHYHKVKENGHGSIWQGRYKSILVQKEHYLSRLGRYIELNPVRAKMIEREELRNYKWSSAHYYLTGKSDKLIKPIKHPYFSSFESYTTSCQERYAQYLQLPHDGDLEIFRSTAEAIGDTGFMSSIALIYDRLRLRAGKPSNRLMQIQKSHK